MYNDFDKLSLRDKYIFARWCYAIGEDCISDIEYKDIETQMIELYPDDEYVNRSWSLDPCPTELLNRIGMSELIKKVILQGSAESIPSLNSEADVKAALIGLSKRSRVSFKIDGWNTKINYYNGVPVSAETRGRTGNFMNANCILKVVPQRIPIMGKVTIRGEANIPNDKWNEYKLLTGNTSQRNSVSSVFANSDTDYIELLAFNIVVDGMPAIDDKYSLLKELGFKTPKFMWVNNWEQLNVVLNRMSEQYRVYNYKADGFVIENDELQLALRIRAFQEEELCSYVTDYTENTGMYGVSMVCDIKPIMTDGVKRSKVSVTNISYIVENNLRKGAPIAFTIRSMVNAVLNVTKTKELQEKWAGNWEEFQEHIDTLSRQSFKDEDAI